MADNNELRKKIEELHSLINEANQSLNLPTSTLAAEYLSNVQKQGPKIAHQMERMLQNGDKGPEQVIVTVTVLAAIWVGAKAVDLVSDGMAHSKAHKLIAAYNQELVVKYGLLVEAQEKITLALQDSNNMRAEEIEKLKLEHLKNVELLRRMKEAMDKAQKPSE